MLISHQHEFIYIRPPKTASTSIVYSLIEVSQMFDVTGALLNDSHNLSDSSKNEIRIILNNNNQKHQDPNHLPFNTAMYFLDNNILKNYFTFSFVRNPFNRVVSMWKFLQHPNQKKEWIKIAGSIDSCDFKTFVRKIKNISTNITNPLSYFTTGVDFVGKCENLQRDFDTICDKIGIPRQELPHKNKTKHKHYTEYYDEETKQIVAEKYAKDIEYFGYKFGE